AGDSDGAGARLGDLLHAGLVDAGAELLLHPHTATARSAAEAPLARARELPELQARDRVEDPARGVVDAVVAAEVTRVVEGNRLRDGSLHAETPLGDQARDELRGVHYLVVAAERGVLVLDAVEAVRAVRDDLLDAVAVQRLDVLLREHLEEVLVAHPPRRVARARLLGAEDREGDAGRVQDLDERAGALPGAVLVGAGAADPEEDVDRLFPRLRHRDDGQVLRPVGARRRGDPPRVAVGFHAAEGGLHLPGELRLLEDQVPAHLDDLVDRGDDEDRTRVGAVAAGRAGPDRVLGDPAADQLLSHSARVAVVAAGRSGENSGSRLVHGVAHVVDEDLRVERLPRQSGRAHHAAAPALGAGVAVQRGFPGELLDPGDPERLRLLDIG